MSLYDDVVTDFSVPSTSETKKDTVDWNNGNFKLMQMQVEAAKKRQSLSRIKPAFNTKTTKNIAPVIDLSDKRGKPQIKLIKENTESKNFTLTNQNYHSNQNIHASPIISSKHSQIEVQDEETTKTSIYSNLSEEYDPMRPNDYEKLLKETPKQTKNKENNNSSHQRRSHDRSRRRKSSRSRSRSRGRKKRRSRRYSSDDDRSRDRNRSRDKRSTRRRSSSSDSDDGHGRKRKHDERNGNGSSRSEEGIKRPNNAFAPPPSLLENTTNLDTEEIKRPEAALPTKSLFGNLKAEKMMAKMGYKEGDGLGRNKQGMSIALQIEKTGKRIGRIIHEKDVVEPIAPVIPPPEPMASPAPPVVGIPADVMKNMSKVILLTNMVAPGDVDDDLEAETKEECAKYGEVNKCIIYELPNKGPDEAVRIFLEFKTLPSAIKALTDLNGRFFGGRSVKATFYNLDKFNRLDLND